VKANPIVPVYYCRVNAGHSQYRNDLARSWYRALFSTAVSMRQNGSAPIKLTDERLRNRIWITEMQENTHQGRVIVGNYCPIASGKSADQPANSCSIRQLVMPHASSSYERRNCRVC